MRCRFCGRESDGGIEFGKWVKPTFTDFDKLVPGEVVCEECLFFFDEASLELAEKMGKDKPQKMRNYSHFIVGGEWIPLSKADKGRMKEMLLEGDFPEVAAIAESGQKHIVFRAVRNPPGGVDGWVQFEEQRVFVVREELRSVLERIEELYEIFSKDEIERGEYSPNRIQKFGIDRWRKLEDGLRKVRGMPIFYLALFLAQRSVEDGIGESKKASRGDFDGNLEGDSGGLQEPVSDEYLGSVRKPGGERGIYEQSAKVHQYSLFEAGGGDRDKGGGSGGSGGSIVKGFLGY